MPMYESIYHTIMIFNWSKEKNGDSSIDLS